MHFEKQIATLATITTRTGNGAHFMQQYAHADLKELEAEGLIEITRPIHQPTGIPYSEEHWHVEVTEAGKALVMDNRDLWPTT